MEQQRRTRTFLSTFVASALLGLGLVAGAPLAAATTLILDLPVSSQWQGRDVAFAPNGNFALASAEGKVFKIDTSTMTVSAHVSLSGAQFIRIAPDNSFAIIATSGGEVHKLDTSTLAASGGFTALTGREVGGLDMSSDGTVGVVTDQRGNVIKFSTATGATIENVSGMGYRNWGVAISPDQTFVYMATSDAGQGVKKVVLDGGSDGPVTHIATGFGATYIDFAPDGSFAYVSSGEGLRRIDASNDTVSAPFTPAGRDVAISPDGSYAYLGGDARVLKINTADDSVMSTIAFPSGTYPYNLDISPDGTYAYAIDHRFSQVYRIPMAPSAPTITGITTSSQSASIAFTPGTDGGSAITGYEYSTDNGATWTTVSPSTTSSPVNVTGLTNGQTYSFRLRARSAIGAGSMSNAESATLPAPPPPPSSGSPSTVQPDPSPSPSPSPEASTAAEESPPVAVNVPAPVPVGEGLVVVDGRIAKVTVQATQQRTWKITGEDFTLEFIPKVSVGEIEGTFAAKAGTEVDIAGDGFVAGSLVATYLPGALAASLGDARVEADGTFTVTSVLPSTLEAGQYVFQVNGLASATSVRSVNLGMQLLPADQTSPATSVSRFVYFKKRSIEATSKAKDRVGNFVASQAEDMTRVVIVPTVSTGADARDRRLARKRAAALRSYLMTTEQDMTVRALKKVRTESDPKAMNRVRVVIRRD